MLAAMGRRKKKFNQIFEWDKNQSELQTARNKVYTSDDQERNDAKAIRSRSESTICPSYSGTEQRQKRRRRLLMKCQVEAIRFDDKSRLTFRSILIPLVFCIGSILGRIIIHHRKTESEWRRGEENSIWWKNIFTEREGWRARKPEKWVKNYISLEANGTTWALRAGKHENWRVY